MEWQIVRSIFTGWNIVIKIPKLCHSERAAAKPQSEESAKTLMLAESLLQNQYLSSLVALIPEIVLEFKITQLIIIPIDLVIATW